MEQSPPRLGLYAGMLSASFITLICIATGHEPDMVLFRAMVGGCVIGGTTALLTRMCWSLLAEDEDI